MENVISGELIEAGRLIAMEGGKPHPAATGGATPSSHHDAAAAAAAAAEVAADESYAQDLYVSQLMELAHDDDWSRFAAGPERPGLGGLAGRTRHLFGFVDPVPAGSSSLGAAGTSAQPIVIDDDAPPPPPSAAAATLPVQLYVPPPLRSGQRRSVTTRQQPAPAPAPARSAMAFLPRPPPSLSASNWDVGTSATSILAQALPSMAPATILSLRAGSLLADAAATPTTQDAAPRAEGRRPAARMADRAAPGTGYARGAGNGRWARATNLMAALHANPRPHVAQFGRIWTRNAADRQFAAAATPPAVSTGTGEEGSQTAPAVSAGKGEAQHSTPAISAGKGGGDHSTPAKAGMEEEVHHNVDNDPVSSKRQVLLADRDTPAVFAGMEDGYDNDWYDSVIREAVITEQQEDPELHGPLPMQYLTPRSKTHVAMQPPRATAAAAAGEEEEEEGEFSMPNFFKKWGLRPSDLDPDEAGPSTRRPRVLPLADDDLPTFDCGICFDTLPLLDLFHGLLCDHKYCLECMTTYINGKVKEGDVPMACPDPECNSEDAGVLHPEGCKKAIDFGAFSDWGLRLAEGAVPHNRRAYCPNRRCGILLETSGEEKPAKAACPACQLLLCATCGGEWSTADDAEHRDCSKGIEAAMVKKLADERRWKTCPKCRMLVERTSGCRVMSCRCRMVFCYICGLQIGAVLEGMEKCKCLNNVGGVVLLP